jgi:hypothetical protein
VCVGRADAHISILVGIKTSSVRALHKLDPFVSIVALVEMSNAGSEQAGHYTRDLVSECGLVHYDCKHYRIQIDGEDLLHHGSGYTMVASKLFVFKAALSPRPM